MKKTEGKASSAALRRARAHDLCVLLKNNAVLLVALAAAGITCFFVPPDAEYGGYFDLVRS